MHVLNNIAQHFTAHEAFGNVSPVLKLIIAWQSSSIVSVIIDVKSKSLIAGQLWKLESCWVPVQVHILLLYAGYLLCLRNIYQKDTMVVCAAGIAGIQAIFNPMSTIIPPPFMICHCHILKSVNLFRIPPTKFAK